MVEHIAWTPDLLFFDKDIVLPKRPSVLPLPQFLEKDPVEKKEEKEKGKGGMSLQEIMETFPTIIDWWEWEMKQNRFTSAHLLTFSSFSSFSSSSPPFTLSFLLFI